MGFLDIGIKKHQEHRQENLLLLSKVHGDCGTSHGLTAYHLFLGSYFEATLTTGMARGTDTLWSSSELFFTRHLPEFIGNMLTLTTTRAFVGYLSFFRGKVRVSRFTQKPFGSKNVLKPTLDMKQQVFTRNKLTNKKKTKKTIHAVNKWVIQLGLIVIEFLPNLRDFPINRMDPERDTYHVSKCHWFRQACTYLVLVLFEKILLSPAKKSDFCS